MRAMRYDETYEEPEVRLFSCLDCGRRDFYDISDKQEKKCTFCGGCLLPMRRLSGRRRINEGEEFDEKPSATRYCVFCKAKLRANNAYPACTTRRCWRQYVVLSLRVRAPLEVEQIILREYRQLGGASYLRASVITIGGRRWVVDGHFRVSQTPPGYEFEGVARMCKKRKKK